MKTKYIFCFQYIQLCEQQMCKHMMISINLEMGQHDVIAVGYIFKDCVMYFSLRQNRSTLRDEANSPRLK